MNAHRYDVTVRPTGPHGLLLDGFQAWIKLSGQPGGIPPGVRALPQRQHHHGRRIWRAGRVDLPRTGHGRRASGTLCAAAGIERSSGNRRSALPGAHGAPAGPTATAQTVHAAGRRPETLKRARQIIGMPVQVASAAAFPIAFRHGGDRLAHEKAISPGRDNACSFLLGNLLFSGLPAGR